MKISATSKRSNSIRIHARLRGDAAPHWSSRLKRQPPSRRSPAPSCDDIAGTDVPAGAPSPSRRPSCRSGRGSRREQAHPPNRARRGRSPRRRWPWCWPWIGPHAPAEGQATVSSSSRSASTSPRRNIADRFEQVLDRDRASLEGAGQDRPAIDEDRRHIETAHGHHHSGQRLVATGKPHQGVVAMASHRRSTELAITSREGSDDFIPSCPIAMPSVTVMVQNSRGVPLAAATPA